MFNGQGNPTSTARSTVLSGAWPAHDAAEVDNPDDRARIVIVCDHASNRIPAHLRDLGLAPDDLVRHIAWDPGALGVSRSLARRLDAPLVHSRVSRLVLDCNREPGLFDSVPE